MWNMIRAQFGERWLQTRKDFSWLPLLCIAEVAFYLLVQWVLKTDGGRLRASSDWMQQDEVKKVFALLRLMFMASFLVMSIGVSMFSTMRERPLEALGFPARRFRLPLRTSVLVACPMIYGFVCSIVLYTLFSVTFTFLSGSQLPSLSFMAVFAGTLSLVTHAADWSVAGYLRRFFLNAFLIALLAVWFLAQGGIRNDPLLVMREGFVFSSSAYAFMSVCCGLSFLAAVWSVGRHRSGERVEFACGRLAFDGSTMLGIPIVRRLCPWSADATLSPARAHFWRHVRVSGFGLAAINAAVLAAILLLTPFAFLFLHTPAPPEAPFVFLAAYAMCSFVVLCIAAPILVAGMYGGREMRTSSFAMTLPLSVRDAVNVELLATICSILLAWSVVIPAGILWLALWKAFPTGIVHAGDIDAKLLVSLGYVILLCPASAWTYIGLTTGFMFYAGTPEARSARVGIRTVSATAVCVALFALFLYDKATGENLKPLWHALAVFAGINILACVVIVLSLARKRGYLTLRGLLFAVCMWLIFIAGLAALSIAETGTTQEFLPAFRSLANLTPHRFMFTCFLTLPLAPFGAVPLSFAALRHQ